ncbi:hypothetical protein HanIR_Chr15g0774921 [Helianthus annuus]|nr:hypothetical protein HanIR_Chr15g0774921 [Helianthus annuus]
MSVASNLGFLLTDINVKFRISPRTQNPPINFDIHHKFEVIVLKNSALCRPATAVPGRHPTVTVFDHHEHND